MYDVTVKFPRMKVGVKIRDEQVAAITYLPLSAPDIEPKNALAERAARELEAYLENPDTQFDLPLLIEGTAFQRRLWEALCAIPRGKTLTYGELAQRLGAAPRAVGQGCGDNPQPNVIPCHRVVAANGIGGFAHSTAGYLVEAKRWLLAHERGADGFELEP